tara:strand:+ start:77 stop:484 length:408 start_codon:yes stop_codon:yes gene_type:complete
MWKWFDSKHDTIYVIFRIGIGLLFMQHGLQKIFGLFGGMGEGATAAALSLMWFAGYIELIGGLAIAVGFFTRLAAVITGLEILIAYITAHAKAGLIPIVNGGELALVYFFCFVMITGHGALKWSLERKLLKREVF